MVRWPNSARVLHNIDERDARKRRNSTSSRTSKPKPPAHVVALQRKMRAGASDLKAMLKVLLEDPSADGLTQIEAAVAALRPRIAVVAPLCAGLISPGGDTDADPIPF